MEETSDSNVDLAAVPEPAGNNGVSQNQQFEIGRSLGSEDVPPPDDFVVAPRSPSYTGSDHLAEKPALPPHIVRARSSEGGARMKVRSRSRPVYKPLYSSSEHLAARPAIPLPQLEAYMSSKAAEPFAAGAPALLDETKVEVVAQTVTQTAPTVVSTLFPPRFSSTKIGFQTPTAFTFLPKSTTVVPVPEPDPEPVVDKPALLHAAEELLVEDSALQVSSKVSTPTPFSSTSKTTTEAPSSTSESSVTEVALTTTEEHKTGTSVTPHSVATEATTEAHSTQASSEQPVKTATTASSASFPTHLYLPDALVLSNQHSKPHHSRFPPATVPTRRPTTTRHYDQHKTTTSKTPPPFPPRRRMTFQPFRKTTPAPDGSTHQVASAQGWNKEQPVPPHYAVGDELYLGKRKEPPVHPVPGPAVDAKSTTQKSLVPTEPSVHTNEKYPEVPQEQDDEHHDKTSSSVQSASHKVDVNQQAAKPFSVEAPASSESAVTTEYTEEHFPGKPKQPLADNPGKHAVPHAESFPARPLHYALETGVVEPAAAGGTSDGEAAVPAEVTSTKEAGSGPSEQAAASLAPAQEEGSLGLPGSLSDQQSALEILEQLHKAEQAPLDDTAAPADPDVDTDGQSSFNIDDMMVSLAMGEGNSSDDGGDKAQPAVPAPAHLTDMQGRVIY
ncbi:hypothetical protein V5799_020559 [Amblyomma americanum]|uniref:Uncharacterized protein n=1 Tax=Amblyomma americanum TaxID=6943 RepID=A0AAQ4D1S8_AMBAM